MRNRDLHAFRSRMHDGTAAKPSLSFLKDSDTGIYRSAAGQLGVVATGGLTLAPHGTSSGNTTELRFMELTAGGSNAVGLKAPDACSDSIYTLPAAFPASNKLMQSTSAGVLSWEDAGGAALTGSTNNTVVTVTGADAMAGEANLTFDGSQLAAPDGSAGAPSVTNTGDLDSGLYFSGANEVAIATAGAQALLADAAGIVSLPLQPAFRATQASASNVTGDATTYTGTFTTEVVDVNADFATGTFTAPVDGTYVLSAEFSFAGLTSSHTRGFMYIVTSNKGYEVWRQNAYAVRETSDGSTLTSGCVVADMEAADTATVTLRIDLGAKVVDVATGFFCGVKVA